LDSFLSEREKLSKQIDHLESQILDTIREQISKKAVLINDINFIGEIVNVSGADALKKLALLLKERLKEQSSRMASSPTESENEKPFVIVLAANIEGKANVAVAVDENLVSSKNLDAVKIIKETVTPLIKGGGGGQKTFASAGGQDVTKLDEVILKIRTLVQ
jgi:alanyl-tRNA synthetase